VLILVVGIFCLIIGHLTGLLSGLYLHWIKAKLNDIWNRDPEPPAQVVTPKRPGYADVTELSAIVTPKTPDQIDREEQERTRNL
jgi:hypothetical protein